MTVTFNGRWHKITDAGINPLPVQRPIPIWFGGSDERALRRLAKLGDGWFPLMGPDEKCRAVIEKIRGYAAKPGATQPASVSKGASPTVKAPPEAWRKELEAWENLGATHVSFNTMKAGLNSPSAHIEAIRRFAKVRQVTFKSTEVRLTSVFERHGFGSLAKYILARRYGAFLFVLTICRTASKGSPPLATACRSASTVRTNHGRTIRRATRTDRDPSGRRCSASAPHC